MAVLDPISQGQACEEHALRARQAYPGIWYGIWTAPDSYNAPYAENPGETYYYFTPTADYPASNANAHANPLLAALKLCGIEPPSTALRSPRFCRMKHSASRLR